MKSLEPAMLLSIAILILNSCGDGKPKSNTYESSDDEPVSTIFAMPDGTQRASGNPPPPSGTPNAPILTNLNSSKLGFIGSTVNFNFTLDNVTSAVAGCYIQVDTADFYFTVPYSSISSNNGRIELPIGLSDTIKPGELLMNFSVYDESGKISNTVKSQINVIELNKHFSNNMDTLSGEQLGLRLIPNDQIWKEVDIEVNNPSEHFSISKAYLYQLAENGVSSLWQGAIFEVINNSDKTIFLHPDQYIKLYYKDGDHESFINANFKTFGNAGTFPASTDLIVRGQTKFAVGSFLNPIRGNILSIRVDLGKIECLVKCAYEALPYQVLPTEYNVINQPGRDVFGYINTGKLELNIQNYSNVELRVFGIDAIFLNDNHIPIFYEQILNFEGNNIKIEAGQRKAFHDISYSGFFGSCNSVLFAISFHPTQ